MLKAVDISSIQGDNNIDVAALYQHVDIVIAKVSQGNWYTNKYAETWHPLIADKPHAYYHYLEATSSAASQVDFFLSHCHAWKTEWTRYLLDYEPTPEAIATGEEFVQLLEKETGRESFPYLNSYRMKNLPFTTMKNHRIWNASYPTMNPTSTFPNMLPSIPGWKIVGWQFTSTGRLPSYSGNLDLSVFNLTTDEWRTLSQNGLDPMITLDDIKNVINDVLLDNSLIWLKDAAGKITYQANIRKAITDTYRNTANNADKLGALAKAVGNLSTVVNNVARAVPNVDLSSVNAALAQIQDELQGTIFVKGDTLTITQTADNGGTAPTAQ